jgi:flagellar biosynthesis protein FlhG
MNLHRIGTSLFAGLATSEPLVGAPRVWAVGGGKGGVGKSVVASNLAGAIAASGRRCTIIDADLGGANLHTLLDVPRPRRTLSHFLTGEVESLAELMVPTSVPNLSLVSGSEALLEMANPKHCRREKLLRQIRSLDVDEVLLDLGAGSAFNVLDAFLIADRGLVVVTPEPTAIENAEHFLKAAFYRSLRVVARAPEVRAAILRLRENSRGQWLRSARELIAGVRRIDPTAAKLLEECAESFAPMLIVNQIETAEHRRIGPELAASCREQLGVSVEYAGCLEADPRVREAVARKRQVRQLFGRCPFSQQMDELAKRLICEHWQAPRSRPKQSLQARLVAGPRPLAAATRPAFSRAVPLALPVLDLSEPGAYLRRCREHLGLSLAEMTERTRIQGLGNIEGERFETLPPEPYLRGFLLEYARELGVHELEALSSSYLARYRGPEAG